MAHLPVTPSELAIAILLVAVGSLAQGSIGFGLAVIAAPILLIVNPAFLPGPMLLAAMVLVTLMALRERGDVIVRDVWFGTIGRILGTLPAAYAVSVLPLAVYELLFASLILMCVVLSALGWHIPSTPPNVIAAAILSGFSGTVSSVGGPPMALVYQMEKGPRIRSTLSAIFTVGSIVSLVGLWSVDRFGVVELLLGLLLLPGVFVGFALSRYTTGHVDRAHTRPAVLAVSAISAAAIFLRAIW